ncbi:DNA-3-methyladenine glycosylase family protein [Halospeciosus flavus]|uniref:DNA-3-methyladenine glycosylase family protein n=1 Tax=Halospeciosus flavus TaxID=3032283 RepID=A0ABD5Z1K7_9EURY|nr:DNA-3-methyladenine glycosylase 2 family protein [Halospeciosus flavus]
MTDTDDAAYEFLRDDDLLGPVVAEHGPLTIEPADDFFERFVTSITNQQVSMAAAASIRESLFDAVEVTPEGILAADDETLREAGLSSQKTRYVNNVAEAFVERGYSKEYFEGMDDDTVRAELTSITGVGEWTADVQLVFSLGREDVFPVGDLGIRKGMYVVLGDDDYTRGELREAAERWSPYRSYASRYLWRVEDEY